MTFSVTVSESDGLDAESPGTAAESAGMEATESPVDGAVGVGDSEDGLSLSLPLQAAANVKAATTSSRAHAQFQTGW